MSETLQAKLDATDAHSILTPDEKREIRNSHTTQQVIIAGLLVAAGGGLEVTNTVFAKLELGRTQINRATTLNGYRFWVSETEDDDKGNDDEIPSTLGREAGRS